MALTPIVKVVDLYVIFRFARARARNRERAGENNTLFSRMFDQGIAMNYSIMASVSNGSMRAMMRHREPSPKNRAAITIPSTSVRRAKRTGLDRSSRCDLSGILGHVFPPTFGDRSPRCALGSYRRRREPLSFCLSAH